MQDNRGMQLSDWSAVRAALERKHSRPRRLRAAVDLLHQVETAIREHEHEHQRLLDAGELVMPEESAAYGDGLRHVLWQLEREVQRLTTLTGEAYRTESSENTQSSSPGSPSSLSDPNEPKEDDLLSLQDVARALGVAYSTVRKKPLRDELPAIKIGARVLVRRSALQEWIEGRERKGKRKR